MKGLESCEHFALKVEVLGIDGGGGVWGWGAAANSSEDGFNHLFLKDEEAREGLDPGLSNAVAAGTADAFDE